MNQACFKSFNILKYKKKVLKFFILGKVYWLFYELIRKNNHGTTECYEMNSKIMQFIIQDILDSGEYTLEGIARYANIPFDVLYDAACGINNQFSIIPWANIIKLYVEVKPEIIQLLHAQLLELKSDYQNRFPEYKNTDEFRNVLLQCINS